jgi:hypothetical protein
LCSASRSKQDFLISVHPETPDKNSTPCEVRLGLDPESGEGSGKEIEGLREGVHAGAASWSVDILPVPAVSRRVEITAYGPIAPDRN